MSNFFNKIIKLTQKTCNLLISHSAGGFSNKPNLTLCQIRGLTNTTGIHSNISSLQFKKRPVRKKKTLEEDLKRPGIYNVVAFATAEEYDLEGLLEGLKEQDLYEAKPVENTQDVVHAIAKYQVEQEPREIFVFREGGVVFWNITDLESGNLLTFLHKYEQDRYHENMVAKESEKMNYKNQNEDLPSGLDRNGDFLLSTNKNNYELMLDKYAFSNGMVLSVKLGIWEALLEEYIEKIGDVTEDLKDGNQIKMTREEVLRRHGELFALRHLINLSSDLLDTPDFYWDNESLEGLYLQVCNYFGITKRTRVKIKSNIPNSNIFF